MLSGLSSAVRRGIGAVGRSAVPSAVNVPLNIGKISEEKGFVIGDRFTHDISDVAPSLAVKTSEENCRLSGVVSPEEMVDFHEPTTRASAKVALERAKYMKLENPRVGN